MSLEDIKNRIELSKDQMVAYSAEDAVEDMIKYLEIIQERLEEVEERIRYTLNSVS